MIAGRSFWIWVWIGILTLGAVGLVPAISWARQTRWRNLDEVLRGIGTVLVSVGMILLLEGVMPILASILLVLSLAMFVGAFLVGRRHEDPHGVDW
jgi:hypothetical protein